MNIFIKSLPTDYTLNSVLVKNVIEMTTNFHKTLRPILILSKCIGLIDISYTMKPTGLLDRNIYLTFPVFLEITRLIVLLICTYVYLYQHCKTFCVLQIINIVKFWIIIIAARLSGIWIIKFINGTIEFDRKCTSLSTNLLTPQRLWTKTHWNTIFFLLFTYFIGFKALNFYLRPISIQNILIISNHSIFSIPYLMDYVVMISLCFFLQNLYARFQTLIDLWKCLPADLVPVSSQWTHIEIVDFMENTRMLHSELCELLKMFSLGYGPLLLCFYITGFINLMMSVYFIVNSIKLSNIHSNFIFFDQLLPIIIHSQIVTFLLSIIIFVSFINEKRIEMISYLRLYRISNLHLDIKRQIKMFMNQISICDSDHISAFGFFDINLNLVTTILILFISGTITLIQMKNHPMMEKFKNETKIYFEKEN